jgi:hypothetical protein
VHELSCSAEHVGEPGRHATKPGQHGARELSDVLELMRELARAALAGLACVVSSTRELACALLAGLASDLGAAVNATFCFC